MRSAREWTNARLAGVTDIAADVREFRFAVDATLANYQPGSHINIRVETPHGPTIRTYTCVSHTRSELKIAVKRHENSRGGSAFMWELEPGAEVEVTLPENRFELAWNAPSYLLIAGGIGVTPLVGMARALAARGADVRMVYAARSQAHLAYADDLRAVLGERLQTYASEEGQRMDLAALINDQPKGVEVYACGPIRMLNELKRVWAEAGRPLGHLRFEVFGDSGEFAEEGFEVEILNRPGMVRVRPDESLLDALLAADIPMIYDCQRGECGLCAVGVLERSGEIDHRDVFFSETEKSEGQRMCACVSRFAGGRAVIDTGYRT